MDPERYASCKLLITATLRFGSPNDKQRIYLFTLHSYRYISRCDKILIIGHHTSFIVNYLQKNI